MLSACSYSVTDAIGLCPLTSGVVCGECVEFEQHFLLRRVALGDCHGLFGTPCMHEHACIRCCFLPVDRAGLGRLEEMTGNVEERLTEAKQGCWRGELTAASTQALLPPCPADMEAAASYSPGRRRLAGPCRLADGGVRRQVRATTTLLERRAVEPCTAAY